MTEWNPNAPEIIGLEWNPALPIGVDQTLYTTANMQPGAFDWLLSDGTALAQRIESLAAEAVTSVELYSRAVVAGRLMLEIYEAGSEESDAPISEVFRPSGDDTITAVLNQAGAAVNLYQSVDEATLDTSDYVTQSGAASAGIYSSIYPLAGALWPAGRRVLDLQLTYVVAATTSVAQQVTCYVISGGGVQLIAARNFFAQSQGILTFTTSLGPDNPFTALPWTRAEIQALGSAAADLELALVFEDQGGGQPNFQLFQQFVTITYCTENREAVASAQIPVDGAWGLRSFTNLQAPDTAVAGWAKAANQVYTYLWRRTLPLQSVTNQQMRRSFGWTLHGWLDSGATAPLQTNNSAASFVAQLGSGQRVTALGAELTRVLPVLPIKAGPTYCDSTQPFVARNLTFVAGDNTGTYASQQVTTTAARTFERLSFLTRPQAANVDEPLVVAIGNSPTPFAGVDDMTMTITYAEIVASENVGTESDPWYLVDVVIPATALGAAVQRYIKWYTAAGVVDGAGWALTPLFGAASGASGTGTYRDATDAGFLNAIAVAYWDYFATLSTIPTPPANVTATPATVDLPGTGEGCSLDSYEAIEIEWDASGDALVVSAEVQRFDELTQSWDTIATVEQDTPTLSYLDPDPAQNIETCYRVRFIRDNATTSDWSAEVCATAAFPDCGLIFVPWSDSAGAVGYTWPTPHAYEFLDAEQLVTHGIYGRDGSVAFRPTETLGDRFEAPVIVNAVATPSPREGRWVFDLLVDLAHNPTTPYVSVLDETGRRWYAILTVPSGDRREPGALYVASVFVQTLQFVPTPVDVTA